MTYPSHYLFQVVPLLLQCQDNLQVTVSQIRYSPGRYKSLHELQKSLAATKELIFLYIYRIWGPSVHEESIDHGDIIRALADLKRISLETKRDADRREEKSTRLHPRVPKESPLKRKSFHASKSQSIDSQLLFRLIVDFQLLLVRIDDAHYVITGSRMNGFPGAINKDTKNSNAVRTGYQHPSTFPSVGLCCLGIGLFAGCLGQKYSGSRRINLPYISHFNKKQLIDTVIKGGSSILSLLVLKSIVNVCWMTDKIIRSNSELLEWNEQWKLTHSSAKEFIASSQKYELSSSSFIGKEETALHTTLEESSTDLCIDEKTRALIDYARKQGRKSCSWMSTGEIRFLMVKRFMDIYYASVGVGVNCMKGNPRPLLLPLVAGAVASFYTITGAPTPTVENESSRDLIQHAWGMVSIPALKNLMLQASKLIKGASVADRLTFCGVPCFILSKDPVPELAAVLRREGKPRSWRSPLNLSRLSTIAETEIHSDKKETNFGKKSFVGQKGQYRQRDVILHLTGGGFFAHTIASDLPYLLDWSSCTESVIICPEYALLPENQFPSQLNQIATIYAALANGKTGLDLGFDANSIIVTGESAGGNLAAALCVQLGMRAIETESQEGELMQPPEDNVLPPVNMAQRMPDAIMLSCPALNLTAEMSHSRVVGTDDPVLPHALISAISEAYLPPQYSNNNPLVSPFYASDEILRRFPPALLFASSKDPLLDDSVAFNERLRFLGVDSELIAVHNVPHAYLGLGTAGFPEAVQVQQYAVEWLSSKLS